jgi:hypothetical protein
MGMEHWWNDTGRGKLKYWEKNIIRGLLEKYATVFFYANT